MVTDSGLADIPDDLIEAVNDCNSQIAKAKKMIKDAESKLTKNGTFKSYLESSEELNNPDNIFELAHLIKSGVVARRLYELGYRMEDKQPDRPQTKCGRLNMTGYAPVGKRDTNG